MSTTDEYERHIAYLNEKGWGRMAVARARVKKHSKARDAAVNCYARGSATAGLRRAEKRLLVCTQDLADIVAAYTKFYYSR